MNGILGVFFFGLRRSVCEQFVYVTICEQHEKPAVRTQHHRYTQKNTKPIIEQYALELELTTNK